MHANTEPLKVSDNTSINKISEYAYKIINFLENDFIDKAEKKQVIIDLLENDIIDDAGKKQIIDFLENDSFSELGKKEVIYYAYRIVDVLEIGFISEVGKKELIYYSYRIVDVLENDSISEVGKKEVIYYANKIAHICNFPKQQLSTSANFETEKPSIDKNSELSNTKSIIYHINEISKIQEREELANEAVKRYALFPILDEKSYEFYQRQEITHWSESELDFVADRKCYDSSSSQIKKIFDTILAFFLVGDGVISKNIILRFLLECKTYEEQAMFISQLHIELIHAATYGLAAFTFKRDSESMAELIESAQNTLCVKRKIAFMEKWMMSDCPRYQRLVAFGCAEGIFFCTLFGVIFWFRSKGWFPNFILANELIGKDESLHRDWSAYLFEQEISLILSKYEKGSDDYNQLYNEIRDSVIEIVMEAVNIEDDFADFILDNNIEDLNSSDLKTYARLIADNYITQLSYSGVFKVHNPFTWLDDISMEQKGNFYEVKIGAYSRQSLSDVLNWRKRAGLEVSSIDPYENPDAVDF